MKQTLVLLFLINLSIPTPIFFLLLECLLVLVYSSNTKWIQNTRCFVKYRHIFVDWRLLRRLCHGQDKKWGILVHLTLNKLTASLVLTKASRMDVSSFDDISYTYIYVDIHIMYMLPDYEFYFVWQFVNFKFIKQLSIPQIYTAMMKILSI